MRGRTLFNFRNIRDSFSLATIYWVFTVLVAVALVTSGVNGSIKKSDESNTNVAQFSTTFPMTVTDDLGRTITIDADRNAKKPIVVIKFENGKMKFVTEIKP